MPEAGGDVRAGAPASRPLLVACGIVHLAVLECAGAVTSGVGNSAAGMRDPPVSIDRRGGRGAGVIRFP